MNVPTCRIFRAAGALCLFAASWSMVLGDAGSVPEEWKLPAEWVQLKAGKGRELAAGQCVVCHSVDYVTTQPPLGRAAWTATVEKMRAKYGAPLPTNSVAPLVDYLVSAYGKPDAPK
ncbi:MAG: cytochrome c [Verrucomicrobia bacterium]|nr:MAG: cytochrome c [Verrucomicrobiota bacterium]